jgi:acetyl-CoA carboxylase biotin carboxyl carrier protein
MDVDMKQVKKLLKLMDDNSLAEISVKQGEDVITLRKQEVQELSPMVATPVIAPVAVPEGSTDEDALPANCKEIVSPMVGTFYRAASPEASSFANLGDTIQEGQVLCILEAMKLMNEFKSECSGKIVKILVENGQVVEYGQPLFIVEN